jgi:ABC-type transport system involved in multi-copper enzyme maturation permease subunit
MTRVRNLFKLNPIIVKEIRSRMRGPRAFITLTIILVLTSAIMYAMLQIILANSRYSTVLSPQIGQILFASLAYLELFIISAVTPAVTSGAISSEKEHLTYEMLTATPMSPTSILWGKLISALSYVFLLLFAAVPLASVVFIFGGVAPRDMIKVLLVLVVTAITFGILGLFMSALFGRTGRASIASFITVLVLLIGPLFLTVLVAAMRQNEPPRWILAPSPISALAAALAPSTGQNSGSELFYILGGIFNNGLNPISQTNIPRPLYHYSLPFYALMSTVLFLLSTRLIAPTRRWNIRRRDLILGIGLVLLIIALILVGFLISAKRYELVTNPDLLATPVAQQVQAFPAQVALTPGEKVVDLPATGDGTLSPTPTLIEGTPSAFTEDEQAQIYAAVIRQLYTFDNGSGNTPPSWPILYLVGSPADSDVHTTFSENVLRLVYNQTSDLITQINQVDTLETVPGGSSDGKFEGGKGAAISFGPLRLQPDHSVYITGSLYTTAQGAVSTRAYILASINGIWQITGTTGEN